MKWFSALFLSLSLLCLPCPILAQEKAVRESFAEGQARFTQRDLDQAEGLLLKTLNRSSPLEDYSLYYLGEISLARGDTNVARSYLTQLTQKFPSSVWAAPAQIRLAKLLLAAKDYPAATEKLERFRNQSVKREISDEALFLLAQIYELRKELRQAYSHFQELRRISPQSPWAARARKEVARLREERPAELEPTTPQALAVEAELLLKERQFEAAEKVYRRTLQIVPSGPQRPRFVKGLAQVLLEARRREEAIPVLSEIVGTYPDSPEAPEALYHLARIHWNRDENLKALEYFNQLQNRYPRSGFSDFAHFASARIFESLGNSEHAQRLYQGFAGKYPSSPLVEEASWRLAWLLYLNRDYKGAYPVFKGLAADGAHYKSASLYWQGRTAERMGRAEETIQIFLQITGAAEETYYRGLATTRLERMGVTYLERNAPDMPLNVDPPPSLSPAISFHLTRARELTEISLSELAVGELDEIRSLGPQDAGLRPLLMREYARNQAYARSASLASQISDTSVELNHYRFPLAYWEMIQQTAETSGLDPYLVVALIRQESLFDPKALSPASAYGLMQLIPSTAARMAKRLALGSFPPENLFEPTLNLRLGTHYLKELLQQYPDSLPKAIAAYNAGENAVARWEKQIPAEDEEEFIERIPYGETRLYVKLVLRNHRIYKKIYNSHR